MSDSGYPVVWVESPLQFVAAAELAAARRQRIRVVFRLGAQMSETAAELLARDALFASCQPYVGIPWSELARASEWIVGDGLSGQFRLAAAVLQPQAVTLLDDGTMSLHLAAGLAGTEPFERPGQERSITRAVLGRRVRDQLRRLAARGRLEFFTMYGVGDPGFAALADLGVRLRTNDFAWTRRTARPRRLPADRILLGSARVTDRLVPHAEHLADVARIAAAGPLVYLPHRRETGLDAIAAIPGVTVVETGLPVELVLAGTEGLEILSSGSTADRTLALLLSTRERAA